MTLRRRLFIGLLIALIYSVTFYATSHAATPGNEIDENTAVMVVFTVLIVLHRLFF